VRRAVVAGLVLTSTVFAAQAPPAGQPPGIDVWRIDSGAVDPSRYFGETVANGMIGILSAPVPFTSAQMLLNGAYEPRERGGVDSLVQTLNFLGLHVAIDGSELRRIDQVSAFHQTLDMKRAVFTSAFDYQDKATISTAVRALRQLPYTAMLEVTVVAKRPITIQATGTIDGQQPGVSQAGDDFRSSLNDTTWFANDMVLNGAESRTVVLAAASAKGPLQRLTLASAQSFIFDGAPETVTRQGNGLTFTSRLTAGATLHFALLGATSSSVHSADPLNESQRLTASAWVQGIRSLVEQHELAWAELWKSDVLVDGDDATERDVHSMLYHLYSFVRADSARSIPPMGLSRGATGYLGHVFWDAETWMLPVLLALQPDLARTMLEYRYQRLPAARRNAFANGYRGAQFPWESAQSGEEDTPLCCLPTEIHITADVAIAAWNYYRVTQDREWLRTRGYPLLEATADFWTSRVGAGGDIEHVVAADENAVDVSNDAFTNAAARENLRDAIAAARTLGITPRPEWASTRRGIPILKFPDGVTREHASYRGALIKQADVNLLAYPLTEVRDPRSIRHDLEYYAPRVDHENGPAMTQSVLAILYERLGWPQKAYDIFRSGYEPNKRPPFGVLAETARSANPYFCTAAGGLLQTLLYGFGGLDITDHGLVQHPTKLPRAWRALTMTGIGRHEQTYRVH